MEVLHHTEAYKITNLETSIALAASMTVDAALEAAKTAASSSLVVLNSCVANN